MSDIKKSKFIKQQETSGLLSSLETKTPLSKIPLVVLFCFSGINKLLVQDKVMLEIHLRQPGFTYSACGALIKNKEAIQKIKETGDS